MRFNKNTGLILLIILPFFSFLIAQDSEKKTLTTSPFIGIKVLSGLEVNLINSDVNKAVVFGPQSDDVILSRKGEVLQIKVTLGSIPDSLPTRVDLYHSKLLNKIIVSQGARLSSKEPLRQTSLSLISNGGAVIDFDIYTSRLDVSANTGGRVELKGKVSNLNLMINTGGSCEAEQLVTEQVKTKMMGGGYAYVFVSELIDAKVIGGSVLRVFGNPLKKIYQQKLGGKIYFEK